MSKVEKVGHYKTKNFIPTIVPPDFLSPLSIKFADDLDVSLITRGFRPGRDLYKKKVMAAQLLYPYLVKGAADSDATHNHYHLMPLHGEKDGGAMMGPNEVFKRLQILLGPQPRHDSKFLTDENEVRQRMDMFLYLRPVFNALLSNPDLKNWNMPASSEEIRKHQTGKRLDLAVVEMLRDMIEHEFFPRGKRADEIPVIDIEKRFSLAKQLIEIQSQFAETSLEAGSQSLQLAAWNTFLILDYPVFKEHPEIQPELLKQAVPVLTKILGNSRFENESWILGEFQTMMNPKALRYNHWQLDGEKRFDIAQLVLTGLKNTLKTRNFETGTVVKILETIEALNFAQEFSDDQKRELLILTLPLLNSIAGSEAVKDSDVVRKLFGLVDFTLLDKQGIKYFENVVEALKNEGVRTFEKVLGTDTKDRTELFEAFKDQGFGEIQRMTDHAQSFLDISRDRPLLGEIPRLILTLSPEDSQRQMMLPAIQKIIKTLGKNKSAVKNQIVRDLLPMTELLYRHYSDLTYQVSAGAVIFISKTPLLDVLGLH